MTTKRRGVTCAPRRTTYGALVFVASLALGACSKSKTENQDTPSSATSNASTDATSTDASAADASATGARPDAPSAFAGTYSVAPGTMYIPETKDYANVKQAKDDPSQLVGEGTLSLTVEDGRVSGTIETGPAGPAVIDGKLVGDDLRGNVRRKDPSDEGLTGTLSGTVTGDTVSGQLSLATANAGLVRDGKFTAKKK